MNDFLNLLKRGLITTAAALAGLLSYPAASFVFNFGFQLVSGWTVASLVFSPLKSLFSLFFPQQMQQPAETSSKLIVRLALGLVQSALYYFAVLPAITVISSIDLFLIKPIQGLYYGITQGFEGLWVLDANRYSILFQLYHTVSARYGSIQDLNNRLADWLHEKITGLFQAGPAIALAPNAMAAAAAPNQAGRHVNFARRFDELQENIPEITIDMRLTDEEILDANSREDLSQDFTRYLTLKNKLDNALRLNELAPEARPQDDIFEQNVLAQPIIIYKEHYENNAWAFVANSTQITDKARLLNHLALNPRLPNGEHLFNPAENTRFKWYEMKTYSQELNTLALRIKLNLCVAPLNIDPLILDFPAFNMDDIDVRREQDGLRQLHQNNPPALRFFGEHDQLAARPHLAEPMPAQDGPRVN